MTNYASDQFYKFPSYEGGGKNTNRNYNDNPNFNYPSNITNPLGSRGSEPIQRGFIRGIYPAVLGKQKVSGSNTVKQRRLFFQFNPTTLDRTVSMNMSMLNPLLQDPTNLLQPVPGSSSFSFDILFNRESEVVTSRFTDSAGNRKQSTPITGSLDAYGENTKPDDVSTLGVLADLYVLDSIIGQSITPDMVDFLKSYWNNASNLSQSTYTAGDGSASFSFNDTAFQTTVQKNYGNSAFLSPLPVRIVFSSLFMVEGFVEQSSVQFVKFTRNYVPTICKVTLSVRALYIGFAREKAYLTDALETAVKDQIETKKKDDALALKMKGLLTRGTFINYVPVYNDNDSNTSNSITFSANYDDYSDAVIQANLFPEPGLVSPDQEFSTFKDWYNSNTPWYKVNYGGTLTSAVSQAMKTAVEDTGVTWKYDATFEMYLNYGNQSQGPTATGPVRSEIKLLSSQINFRRMNNNPHENGGADIANNANKKVIGSVNNDRWYIHPTAGKVETVLDTDKVTFSILHNYTMEYTSNSGPATVTYSYRSNHTFSANSTADWAKVRNAGLKWRMYSLGYQS
jgi:hypothetical protein